ncbi:hypothetical protein QJV03_00425 [Listeria swaminathanii]|uniref:DUF4868 domain-containing protein n=1 Tax=Listeria swaminathanii TaxID=2713501 RepID=A0ABU2IEE8_9LIST|nr:MULTISPECIES: hypothetical protein [Listeria]MCD2252390.1 hypothetical protein [Listeria marthii]MDT0015646.1 hypothetical protein [Listeria swaminathanii]MDT0021083.1 hypothetical protein [Listeria swaminathanii]MDT0032046.1 hypothetical protein [Listeria swaminathanii]MDT0052104.1 hypothetical protein [Listeria swaminathanii]
MSYNCLWIGMNRGNKLDRLQRLFMEQPDRDRIVNELENISELLVTEKLKKYSSESLLFDDGYCISLEDIGENHFLDDFTDHILMPEYLGAFGDNVPISKYTKQRKYMDLNKDKFKFLILESKDDLLFLPIQARGIVKPKTMLKIPVSSSTGDKSMLYDLGAGITVPTTVCAQFNKNKKCLYVINNLDFEMMLGTFEHKKNVAQKNLLKFKDKQFRVGAERYSVQFEKYNNIEKAILDSKRTTIRLSKYEETGPEFDINKIQKAVEKLPATEQVTICKEKQVIEVNADNYKTFIAIIHNSIVERLISGEVGVI